MSPTSEQVASLLARAQRGDSAASNEILPLVYEDLRRLAQWHMSREREAGAGQTLQPTALVHEAYVRLLRGKKVAWADKRHFFAAAGIAMRRILVERARRITGPRAGGGKHREPLTDQSASAPEPAPELDWELLDRAMTALHEMDPELAEIVHLRYFAGMNIESTALALDSSPRTIDRRWQVARAWLLEWTARHGAAARLVD